MFGVFKITFMLIKFYKHMLPPWNNYHTLKCEACGKKATATINKHEIYLKEDDPIKYKDPKIVYTQICQVCDDRNCFLYLKLKYC